MPNSSFASAGQPATLNVAVNADTTGFREGLNEASRSGRQFGTGLATAFDGLTQKGKSLTDVMRTFALSLSNIAFKAAFKPLEDGFGSLLANAFSGGASTGGFGFAHGGVFAGGVPVPFADGGVITSPISFPLAGGASGIAGERGPEAIMPLARGPDGSLGVAGSLGGGAVQIHFTVTSPDASSFQRSESQITAMLARAVERGQRNL